MINPTRPHPTSSTRFLVPLSPCLLVLLLLLTACTPDTAEVIITVTRSITTTPAIARLTSIPAATLQPTPSSTLPPGSPTPLPSSTPSPEPTPLPPTFQYTPVPTSPPSRTPTTTPIATIIPPIQILPAGQLPAIPRDLLFVISDTIHLWNHQTGQIETFFSATATGGTPAQLRNFQVIHDGRAILVTLQTLTEPPTFELILIDRATRQTQPILTGLPASFSYALAPDGQQLAYVTTPPETQVTKETPRQIYLTSLGGTPTYLADCQTVQSEPNSNAIPDSISFCSGLVWTPDGQYLWWRDVEGIRQTNLAGESQLLIAHQYYPNDWPLLYSPSSQSSADGRYQFIIAERSQASTYLIFDRQTLQTMELPESFVALRYENYWSWTSDNRLATVRYASDEGTPVLVGQLWRISQQELILDQSLSLGPTSIPFSGFAYLSDGRFTYIVSHRDQEAYQSRGLFIISADGTTVQKVNGLPPLKASPFATWAPDGQGVILQTGDEPMRILYALTDNATIYDLSLTINPATASSFHWLP